VSRESSIVSHVPLQWYLYFSS